MLDLRVREREGRQILRKMGGGICVDGENEQGCERV